MSKRQDKFEMYKQRYKLYKKYKEENIFIYELDNVTDFRMNLPVIYSYNLIDKNTGKDIVLYVGKTLLLRSRVSQHNIQFLDNPNYFGLKWEDFDIWDIKIKIKIERIVKIDEYKNVDEIKQDLTYQEQEFVKILRPITQSGMNMINDWNKKRHRVEAFLQTLSISQTRYNSK